MKNKPYILVIDAQGGGLGKQLITRIRKECSDVYLTAVGTNTVATAAMLKAGADEAATGENSVVVASRRADYIIGPIGIVIADAMTGEITPAMAGAVGSAEAVRILLPFNTCDNYIAGVSDFSTGRLIEDAVLHLKKRLNG
ncbi:MAG: DUF3842 family protein [Lachnospiraceae bacterium]|nr:DUF3842 family protein [Lachnospiraceae bacterium]